MPALDSVIASLGVGAQASGAFSKPSDRLNSGTIMTTGIRPIRPTLFQLQHSLETAVRRIASQ